MARGSEKSHYSNLVYGNKCTSSRHRWTLRTHLSDWLSELRIYAASLTLVGVEHPGRARFPNYFCQGYPHNIHTSFYMWMITRLRCVQHMYQHVLISLADGTFVYPLLRWCFLILILYLFCISRVGSYILKSCYYMTFY